MPPPRPDPIGGASARLFAAGLDGPERLVALRFLGILLARADDEGRLHADADDLVGLGILNDMEPEEVEDSRRSLEAAGVLKRDSTGWFIRDFAPVGDEVPPAEALGAIARVLGRPLDAERPVPAPVEAAPVAAVKELTPVPEPSSSRFSSRWMAAPVGIAAAVLALALVLSGQVQLHLPGRAVSDSRENAQEVNSASPAAPSEAAGTSPQESAGAPGSPATGTSPAPAGTQAPATAASGRSATAATVACPLGGVVATVEQISQNVDGSVPTSSRMNISLPQVVRTTVSGVVRNTSTAGAVVAPFAVEVTFTDAGGKVTATMSATALPGQTAVEPGPGQPWSVVVDTPPSTPVPTGAKANVNTWRWADPALASACPR